MDCVSEIKSDTLGTAKPLWAVQDVKIRLNETLSEDSNAEPILHGLGNIDTPKIGETGNLSIVSIAGWFFQGDNALVGVAARSRNSEKICADIYERSDVAAHFGLPSPLMCGFSFGLTAWEFSGEREIKIVAILQNTQEVEIASLSIDWGPDAARMQISDDIASKMPGMILVDSYGRSGSTLIMSILAKHKNVVAIPTPPLESRFVQDLSLDLQLSTPYMIYGNAELSKQIDGLPPGGALFGSVGDDIKLKLFEIIENNKFKGYISAVLDYFKHLNELYDKPEAAYLCEKLGPGSAPRFVHWAFPRSKEIILIRDIRDVIISYFEYDLRYGIGFSASLYVNPDAFFELMALYMSKKLAKVVKSEKNSYLLKYEDIILNAKSTLNRLFEFLEIDSSDDVVEALIKNSIFDSSHATAATPEASVGRWKTEAVSAFPIDFQHYYVKHLEWLNRSFGYE